MVCHFVHRYDVILAIPCYVCCTVRVNFHIDPSYSFLLAIARPLALYYREAFCSTAIASLEPLDQRVVFVCQKTGPQPHTGCGRIRFGQNKRFSRKPVISEKEKVGKSRSAYIRAFSKRKSCSSTTPSPLRSPPLSCVSVRRMVPFTARLSIT